MAVMNTSMKTSSSVLSSIATALLVLSGCDLGNKNVGDENDDSNAGTGDPVDPTGDDGDDGDPVDPTGGDYDPCAGSSCGDVCSICPPDDEDCIETAEIKACNEAGQCVSDNGALCDDPGDGSQCADAECGTPCTECGIDELDCTEPSEGHVCNGAGTCIVEVENTCEWLDPCGGQACGATCSTCPPGEACPAVEQYCDSEGTCSSEFPTCEDPCAGLSCGEPCSTCPPGKDCPAIAEACNPAGECVDDTGDLCVYEPCDGLQCGDACALCPPWDEDCVETAEVKACDENAMCVSQGQEMCG